MIEEIIEDDKLAAFKVKCDMTGTVVERVKPKEDSMSLSNIESALSDAEIEKFKNYMGDKIKTDCWCKHLADYVRLSKEGKVAEDGKLIEMVD